ncbi:MAG: hypothetical protein JSU95_19080 [Betaproteobacteria bacterium]|nr:MAG: hypothetical protein JSU95_19080 [Betaproteobacteria bacterium]
MVSRRILVLVFAAFLTAPAVFADDELSGLYEGRIGDATAVLNLRVSKTVVSGWITQFDGNDVNLKGSLSDGKIVGAASTSRGAGFFEAQRELDALVIVIREFGAVTGQAIDVRAKFSPTEAMPKSNRATSSSPKQDPTLVGTWTTRGLARQGDMVLPINIRMTLGRDGRYSQTSKPPTDSEQGEWRNRGRVLEYRPQESEAWSQIGEYQLYGDHLITIVPEREPQIWRRVTQDQ